MTKRFVALNESIKNGAMTIQRADILNGLQALHLTLARFNRLLKEDSYACGYREGFADALVSVAQMIGEGLKTNDDSQ